MLLVYLPLFLPFMLLGVYLTSRPFWVFMHNRVVLVSVRTLRSVSRLGRQLKGGCFYRSDRHVGQMLTKNLKSIHSDEMQIHGTL